MMPDPPLVSDTSFLLYNPGTEMADTVISLSGDVGSGLLIRNLTTGQRCAVRGLPASGLLDGEKLVLDSRRGQTYTMLGDKKTMAFAFHDEGYIRLAPCAPFVRAAEIHCTDGISEITSAGLFTKAMVGQYIYQDGWVKISEVINASHAILSRKATVTGSVSTPIVTMNEIRLESDDAVLTHLSIQSICYVR